MLDEENTQPVTEPTIPPENPDCKWCEFRHCREKYAYLFNK